VTGAGEGCGAELEEVDCARPHSPGKRETKTIAATTTACAEVFTGRTVAKSGRLGQSGSGERENDLLFNRLPLGTIAVSHPAMKNPNSAPKPLDFRNNLPFIPQGVGFSQVWFSGGRMACTILEHGGIGEILYFGRQSVSHSFMFRANNQLSAWEKLFRFSVVIDGTPYYPEFNNTTYYPFGFTSECTTVAIDELSKKEIAKQIWDKTHDVRDHFPISDTPYGETHIGVMYDRAHFTKGTHVAWKQYVSSGPFTDQAALMLVFAPGAAAYRQRAGVLKKSVHQECDALFALFEKRQKLASQVRIPSEPVVQSLIANVPRVIDAVELKDVPGAFRAGMQGYFVWMDLMIDAVSFLYANDADSLRDMFTFFQKRVDKKRGMPCLVTTHLTPLLATPFSNQCCVITSFYNYYCFTGDEKLLRSYYPLLRFIIEKCAEREVKGTGLIEGAGLPDHPAEQNGHDITSTNNSSFYQAMKCMPYLSREMTRLSGDEKHGVFGRYCEEFAARTRKNFVRYFFDKKVGYFRDSLSSEDFSPRRHYPTFVIQWATPFAADLITGNEKRIAAFMAKNFLRPQGVGPMFPPSDPMYPGDGNQWLAYYPSWTEAFFRGAMRAAGRGRELAQIFDVINWFWSRYTIPEGFTYDAENEGFTADNPGGKQPFGGQGFYGNFFRTIVGLEVDERGVIVTPSPARKELSVEGLIVRGKKIDLSVTGTGRHAEISFNGEKLGAGPAVIPFRKLKAKNRIVVRNG
jgi:hypothetical protein